MLVLLRHVLAVEHLPDAAGFDASLQHQPGQSKVYLIQRSIHLMPKEALDDLLWGEATTVVALKELGDYFRECGDG